MNKVELYGHLYNKSSENNVDNFSLSLFSARTNSMITVPVVIMGGMSFDDECDCLIYGELGFHPNNPGKMCVIADSIIPNKPFALTYKENNQHSFDGYMEVSIPVLDVE